MPKIAYARVIHTWEALLRATRDELDSTELEPYLGELQRQLDKLRKLKARQESATALRQRCTQEINEGIAVGNALVMRLRGLVRGKMGPYNEQLVQFGVRPVRSYRSRRTMGPEERLVSGETPPAGPDEGDGVN